MRHPKVTSHNPVRAGITLIEVLVSMAIFMFALAAISQLVDIGSRQGLESARTNTATRLAQSKLAEIEAGVLSIYDAQQGTFEEEPNYNWSINPISTNVLNVYEVEVRVWTITQPAADVTITQMILDPEVMGNAAEAQPPATE